MSAISIKKQVEFYFSDSNYRKDVFLKSCADSDPDGFVPISVLLTFNKLKALSKDPEEIAAALKESKVVTLSEDSLSVRRMFPLPEADTSKACTLYVKGFPTDDADVSIESIGKEFEKFGEVKLVRMKKDVKTKAFRGSAFIEFGDPSNVEAACKAAYEEDKTTVKLTYKEKPYLCVLSLTDYLERKKKARKEMKDKSDKDPKKRKRVEESATGLKVENVQIEIETGCILKVSDLPTDATALTIKDAFKTTGNVKFVEYNSGDPHALVRFADAIEAQKALTVVTEGFKISESDEKLLKATMLEGEEETSCWTKMESSKRNKPNQQKRGGGKWNNSRVRGRGRGRR
jgi:lupus La protein